MAEGENGAGGEDLVALREKAEALAQDGKFPEAEKVYRSIVKAVKESLGKQHAAHGAALYDLARVLSAESKHVEAQDALERALAIFEVDPGVAQPPYGHALHSLAGVLGAQDKFADAEQILRGALEKQERALGKDSAALGPTLTNLAIALVQNQKLDEAETVVTRSLAIAEEAHGEAHEETSRILTILAQVQAALGKDEAGATARRALNALVAIHGPDHPLVAEVKPMLEEIAEPSTDLEAAMQEGAEALEMRDAPRAIAILGPLVERARREGLLPVEASASGMLAQAFYVTGRAAEGIVLAKRALAIAEEAGQEDAAAHFRELVSVMEHGGEGGGAVGLPEALHRTIEGAIETAQRGDIVKARALLEASADEAEATGDAGAEATVRIVLGQILQASGHADAADAHLKKALAIAEGMSDRGAADHVRRLLGPSRVANGEKPS